VKKYSGSTRSVGEPLNPNTQQNVVPSYRTNWWHARADSDECRSPTGERKKRCV